MKPTKGVKNLLRIVICDDEDFYIGDVSRLLSDYEAGRPELELAVSAYTSPFALLDDLDSGKVGDIYLLDIYMDVMNGVELARTLRRTLPECQIVFLTTSREHAVEAFEVGAAHYLEKPIGKERFGAAMDRATAALIKRPVEQLACQTGGGGVEIIPFSDIILAESLLKEQRLELTGGRKLLVRETLSSLIEKLGANEAFVSPHRSFIVNLKHAAKIDAESIVMTNGTKVPLSRNSFMKIKERFIRCVFNTPASKEGK